MSLKEGSGLRRDGMTRRAVVAAALAVMAARKLAWAGGRSQGATPTSAQLSIDETAPGFAIPSSFMGLSYESAQLANTAFFSPRNHELIKLVRRLSPAGVLRLGGGSSEFTTYQEDAPAGPPPFEVFGPDTSKTVKKGTVTSGLALRELRGFLDATGWSCLYGLNLGQGTVENAQREAEAAYRILGSRLLALQIGNEPDSFKGRYRPQTYTPSDFMVEWRRFHDAIVERVPQAKFAGPDISNKLSYLTEFAEATAQMPDVILLTMHYYAMGPAGRPEATMANLLSESPISATLKWKDAPVLEAAMHVAGRPMRISEANSCWNGGQAGVSDVFGSALWCADTMLRFATMGIGGMNMHGGGNGIYSPIVGSPSTGFQVRPEFYGMRLVEHFAGSTLLKSSLACSEPRMRAYVARKSSHGGGVQQILLINKSDGTMDVRCDAFGLGKWRCLQLSAPAVDATSDIRLADVSAHHGGATVNVAAYSAMLLER